MFMRCVDCKCSAVLSTDSSYIYQIWRCVIDEGITVLSAEALKDCSSVRLDKVNRNVNYSLIAECAIYILKIAVEGHNMNVNGYLIYEGSVVLPS